MQSQEEKLNDKEKAIAIIKNFSYVKEKLNGGKDIVFMFTANQTAGENIKTISQHFLTKILEREMRKSQKQNLREETVKFLESEFFIVENSDTKIVALNVSNLELKTIPVLLSHFIKEAVSNQNRKVKLIGVIGKPEGKLKLPKQINLAREYFGIKDNTQLAVFQANQNLTEFGLHYTTSKQKIQTDPNKNLKLLWKSTQKIFDFKPFIDAQRKGDVKKYLQDCRRCLQYFENYLLNPVNTILTKILQNKEHEIENEYQDIYLQLKQNFGDLQTQNNAEKVHKNDQKIAYKWFAHACLKIKEQFENQLKKQKTQPISWLKNFSKKIFGELKKLPINQVSQLNYIEDVNNLAIQQFKTLKDLSNDLYPQNTTTLSQLVLKENDNEIDHEIITKKLIEIIISSELLQSKKIDYYNLFANLIKECVDEKKFDKNKQQGILKKKNSLLERIPLMRIQAIISHECYTKEEIRAELPFITDFLLAYENDPKSIANDWSILINIFAKFGQKLYNYGFPEVAIEVFKKIQMTIKVQECVKDIILKKGWRKKIEGSQLYAQTADYFEKNGQLAKSYKYASMAYENWPQQTKFLLLKREKHQKMIKNEVPVQCINKGKIEKLDDFFNYKFSPSFRANVERIEYEDKDIETTFDYEQSLDEVDYAGLQ